MGKSKKSIKIQEESANLQAKVRGSARKRRTIGPKAAVWKYPFEKKNYVMLAVSLAIILLGFGLMATGITEEAATPDGTWRNPLAISVAPVLLVIGYCVLIPYSIMKYFGVKAEVPQNEE